MLAERLVEFLGKKMERRSFLGKLGIGAIGALTGLMGLSKPAAARCTFACCGLCVCPSGSCSNCACTWCWVCSTSPGVAYKCCECHSNTTWCGGQCRNVNCSWVEYLSSPAP